MAMTTRLCLTLILHRCRQSCCGMKTYTGLPHGMPTTNADQINSDLIAFLKDQRIGVGA
jgi:hypothetical protein